MSITSNIRINHSPTGADFRAQGVRTPTDPGFALTSISVGTADEEVDDADFLNPRQILLRLLSGSDLRVGLDGSAYPFRLSGANDYMILRLDVEGRREITSITTTADTAGSLGGDYFDLTDRNGTVRVWFDVANGSTPPATPGGGRLIEVDIASGAANTAVATAVKNALDADAEFSATVSGAIVLATDAYVGTRTDVADGAGGAATGFTLSVSQQGAVIQPIHMKSVGTSQVVVGVIPD